jgi:hypothetical protein
MAAMPQSTHDTQAGTHVFPIRELLAPQAFQHPVSEIALRETHISWIVLTGSFAYKIKKAVKFDFIDSLTWNGAALCAKRSCASMGGSRRDSTWMSLQSRVRLAVSWLAVTGPRSNMRSACSNSPLPTSCLPYSHART